MTTLSIIIPIHNDSEQFLKNYQALLEYLSSLKPVSGYEVVLADNGSSDVEQQNVKAACIKNEKLRYFYTPIKGIGSGMRLGLSKANNETIFIYSVDYPFGFGIIEESIKAHNKNGGLILGSKKHKDSKTKTPLKRKILSFFYNTLIRALFGLDTKDTQGTMLLTKETYEKTKEYLTSDSGFMQAQLCIYTQLLGYKVTEIPVQYLVYRKGSKINPIKDSIQMLRDILGEYSKYLAVKKKLKRTG